MIRLKGPGIDFNKGAMNALLPPDLAKKSLLIQVDFIFRLYLWTRSVSKYHPAFTDTAHEQRDHLALGLRNPDESHVVQRWRKIAEYVARHRTETPNYSALFLWIRGNASESEILETKKTASGLIVSPP